MIKKLSVDRDSKRAQHTAAVRELDKKREVCLAFMCLINADPVYENRTPLLPLRKKLRTLHLPIRSPSPLLWQRQVRMARLDR